MPFASADLENPQKLVMKVWCCSACDDALRMSTVSVFQQYRSSHLRMDKDDPLVKAVVKNVVIERREDVLLHGETPHAAHLLLDGQAYRYRLLPDGRRQITSFLVPGDVCELDAVLRGRAGYGVLAVTSCVLGELPVEVNRGLEGINQELRRALCQRLVRDQAIAWEWIVTLGRRSISERLAHFICELRERQNQVGFILGDYCRLALTQVELGDLLGSSTVHVNRTLKELQNAGLIDYDRNVVHVLNHKALIELAGFDDNYLRVI